MAHSLGCALKLDVVDRALRIEAGLRAGRRDVQHAFGGLVAA